MACSDLDRLHFSSTPTANNRLEEEKGQGKGLILQQILGYTSSPHRVSLSALLGDELQKNTAARFLPWEAWALHEKVFWMILSFTENQAQHATSPQVCHCCLSSHFASRSGALGHDAIFGFHHQRPSQGFMLEFVDVLFPRFRTPTFKALIKFPGHERINGSSYSTRRPIQVSNVSRRPNPNLGCLRDTYSTSSLCSCKILSTEQESGSLKICAFPMIGSSATSRSCVFRTHPVPTDHAHRNKRNE